MTQRRRGRGRSGAGAAALLLVVAPAMTAAVAAPADDLEAAREDVTAAEIALDELLDDVAAADEELAVSRDRAALAAADAAAARVLLDEVLSVAEAAAARLAAVTEQRARADLERARARDVVDARAAEMWMRGSAADSAVVAGVFRADDLHDVAVRWYAVGRAAESDRVALEDATASFRVVVDLAEDERAARQQADRASAEAAEQRRVAELREEQAADALGEAEAAQAARRTALAALEDDLEARRALVERLSTLVPALGDVTGWLEARGDVPLDGPAPEWAELLPAAGRPWAPAIAHAASGVGIDPRLLAALVWTESSFRPGAVSPAGAIGLAQLMPPTAAELGVDPRDPVENLRGGARYLRQQMDRFGRLELALAAYNAGPGAVRRAGPAVPDFVETQVYVVRIAERLERLGA